jgi:hypothetical protein
MSAVRSSLDTPIDVMYLLHKALRAQAAQVEEAVRRLQDGDSLQPFRHAFYQWVMALEYHGLVEDASLAALGVDWPATWQHATTHRALEARLEEVQSCLCEEIGRTFLIARTRRHLFGKVVAARLAQEDHLEEEEAVLLPLLRRRLAEPRQLEIVRQLLIDQEAADHCWILDWLAPHLSGEEQRWLSTLLGRLAP